MVSGSDTSLNCVPNRGAFPCYVTGGYPPEVLGNKDVDYNGRLLSVTSGADTDTITLTTDASTPFNAQLAARYSVTLVGRDGERVALPSDMTGPGVDISSPDTMIIHLQPDSFTDEQLIALRGEMTALVFTNEGMSRIINRTPGPRPGLAAQLILGLVGAIAAFWIAGIGRYITPVREIIATAVVAACMSILPAMNWGGSFWFVGAIVVLMIVTTVGLMALKARAG